jgi:2-dehydropantoate 2-reductase
VTRYVVLGAGAVGGTIGGRLADAGHDVVLVARGAHAAALRADGLRLAMPERVLTLHIPVAELGELALRSDDVVIIATKVQDAAPLLTALASLPGAGDLPVICAQNGVEGERIALRRFSNVYGICVMLPAVHLEPGRIDAQGTPYSGSLDLGRYPRGLDDTAHQLAEALQGSGFVSQPREDILPWKYAKLLRNVGNAVEALGGDQPEARDLGDLARAEAEAVLVAAGISWTGDVEWKAYRGRQVQIGSVEGRSRGGGSSWQSVTRGAGSIEADHLNGEIVLLGRLHGVPTPVNALLQQEANALVTRGGPAGSVDLAALLARLQ